MSVFDPRSYLESISDQPDQNIDPALVALALAAFNLPEISTGRYVTHLEKMAYDVAARFDVLIKEGSTDDAGTRLAALKHVISDRYGYAAFGDAHENLEAANLIRVIELRRGLPLALALLYVHAAQAQGWDVCVLDFFQDAICRIEHDGVRLIFDPAQGCRVLQAPDLRALVKARQGAGAELSAQYYEPVPNRALVIALENHIKSRLIEGGDYVQALEVIARMEQISPDEYRLWLDAGVLQARTGQKGKAVMSLEKYISVAPPGRDRDEAFLLMQQIQEDIR